ncbi:MAG: hypothetical protein WCG21_10570 [Eubacteriales bacterium]
MKKILIMLMLITTLLLCPFSVLRADAAYQISIQSNTEYAVFTLSYTGAVTGLQVTSPNGIIYDQSSAGAAYKISTGKIQIGVRFAETGKWTIFLSGSPDNGFQIMITSDASYGDFAGTVPSVIPTLQPTPTPQPTPTASPTPVPTFTPTPTPTPPTMLIPIQTKEEIITTKTPSSTNTSVPKPTKDTSLVPTLIPEAGSLTITPTIGAATIAPTVTPKAAAIIVSETELPPTPTPQTETGLLEEKQGSNLSILGSKEFLEIYIYVFAALLLIGIILMIAKKRNRIRAVYYQIGIRRSDKNQKRRIRLQQQVSESYRLRAQRQIEADAAQIHTRKVKEEAAADAELLKKKRSNEAEISRLHALQVKATVETLRIQRRQEKEEEKNHINKQRKEEREAARCLTLQIKENSTAVRIQSSQEQLEEKTRVKKKRIEESVAERLARKQEKENASSARIHQHITVGAKERNSRVQKKHALLKRLVGLHKKMPVMQSQQELQLRNLFESQLEKERVVLAEMEVEAKARVAAIKESRGKQ